MLGLLIRVVYNAHTVYNIHWAISSSCFSPKEVQDTTLFKVTFSRCCCDLTNFWCLAGLTSTVPKFAMVIKRCPGR